MILINNQQLQTEIFPNGEIKIKEFEVKKTNYIFLKWESDKDLINLMFVKSHIDGIYSNSINYLKIPYFPYSRMDRKIEGDLFTLSSVCDFINKMNFDTIWTYDAHSDICLNKTDRIKNINYSEKLFYFLKQELRYDVDYIFYPDRGAKNRYNIKNQMVLTGNKNRDEKTGKILSYNIEGSFDNGSSICIIDDLSSYGGTFAHASNQLKEMGAGNIFLIVTHCEESILKGSIFTDNNIELVLTTNSIIGQDKETDKLIIKNIFKGDRDEANSSTTYRFL